MRVYVRDLIRCASPLENIVLLERLRRKYGEVMSDSDRGSYFVISAHEDLFGMPAYALDFVVHEEEQQ